MFEMIARKGEFRRAKCGKKQQKKPLECASRGSLE
jgi:hypothetical protein